MSVSVSGTTVTFPDSSTITSGWTGFKNRIINGAMQIDQRNAGASVTPNSTAYTLDRWQLSIGVSSKLSIQQSSTAPTGFSNSVLITTASAYTASASDYLSYCTKIEGLNVSDLAWGTASASAVTLSFWVRSSLTGTFSGAIQNSGASRSYPFTFTISSANTFEYKTVTIAGDTSGTWLTNNGIGMEIHFNMGSGSSRLGTAGAWNSNWNTGATGSVALVQTAGATMYITGVQLEKGSTASSFEYRAYGQELQLCQRYGIVYSTSANGDMFCNAYNNSTTQTAGILQLPVPMRSAPSVTFNQSASSYGAYLIPFNTVACSAVALLNTSTPTTVGLLFTTSGLTAGSGNILKNAGAGTANITISAEL